MPPPVARARRRPDGTIQANAVAPVLGALPGAGLLPGTGPSLALAIPKRPEVLCALARPRRPCALCPAMPWALGPSTMFVHMMGTIQFLVAVGLRSLFSCWWLAGSGLGSQQPPSGPATWPSPLSGLLLVASCLLQGTHTTVASHSQALSGSCPHSVRSWSQVSAQGTCGQAPQSTSLSSWLFSDHFYV